MEREDALARIQEHRDAIDELDLRSRAMTKAQMNKVMSVVKRPRS